jgi:hypothetical protein
MTLRQELDMFGCSIEALRAAYADSFTMAGPALLVMSILSDVQEIMASVAEGDSSGATGERLELARQYINRAKFGVTEYLRG